jgi:hypothetical protein
MNFVRSVKLLKRLSVSVLLPPFSQGERMKRGWVSKAIGIILILPFSLAKGEATRLRVRIPPLQTRTWVGAV